MDRLLSIAISVALSLVMYFGFIVVLKGEKGRRYLGSRWYYHPNAICVWRVFIGLAGTLLYFLAGYHDLGIFLFTISAMMDAVDGLIARSCDLITEFGEELDPLCDKLTYLPPVIFFGHLGMLNIGAVWILLVTEAVGQFLVRYFIKRYTKFSVAANNFGKIKAVLCFVLIIYLALMDGGNKIPDFSNQMLYVCIILSISSSAFKIIPNHYYADILSFLNLLCGLTGMFLIFQGRYVYVAIAILTGQIFDLFDGRMADKHGGTRLGPWFDDIADLISFGLCPALLIISKSHFSLVSFITGIIYFLSIGFRLWRFLVHDKYNKDLLPGIFNGLPSPAGAMVVVGACLFWKNTWMISAVAFLTSFLLVSHIRFVHFGRVILKRIPRIVVIIFGFFIVFIIAYQLKARDSGILGALLLLSFLAYIIMSSKVIMTKNKALIQ